MRCGRLVPHLVALFLLMDQVLYCLALLICFLVNVWLVFDILYAELFIVFRLKTLFTGMPHPLSANALDYVLFLLNASALLFDYLLPVIVEFLLELLDQFLAVGSKLESPVVLVHEEFFSLCAHVLFVVDEAIFDFAKFIRAANNARNLVERGRLVHVDLMPLHCLLRQLI